MSSTYLVTGGAGFIGSHLTDALLAQGHTVVVLDDLSTGDRARLAAAWPNPKLRFVRGSALDARLVDELAGRCGHVIHLAAADVRPVLAAALRHGRPLLLAGPADDGALALAHHREHGLPVTVARLFDTVGPRESPAHGTLVPRLAAQAVAGQPLTVHGDGSRRHRLTHVTDVVDALLRLLARPDAAGGTFDVARSEETTAADLARTVVERSGSPSPLRCVPYETEDGAEAEVPYEADAPDTRALRALTGWAPRAGIEEMVDAALVDAGGAGGGFPGPAAPMSFPPTAQMSFPPAAPMSFPPTPARA
ncbi:NAD-dependent epimerase/dehydratase family protein [Streptomyces sp. NPDC050400]|uniref:NAD-dependent epimerase/dehydratase family protein n=1 Tax=Streptomyces sp. NPDC050400 TaxID=3365610 RepID=UPI0037BB4A92